MDSKYSSGNKKHRDKRHQQNQHETNTTNLIIDDEQVIAQYRLNNTNNNNNNYSNQVVNSSNSCNSTNTKKKWKCMQCTYENWPSALKCTICLYSKTSQTLTSSSTNVNTTSSPSLLSTSGPSPCLLVEPSPIRDLNHNKSNRNSLRKNNILSNSSSSSISLNAANKKSQPQQQQQFILRDDVKLMMKNSMKQLNNDTDEYLIKKQTIPISLETNNIEMHINNENDTDYSSRPDETNNSITKSEHELDINSNQQESIESISSQASTASYSSDTNNENIYDLYNSNSSPQPVSLNTKLNSNVILNSDSKPIDPIPSITIPNETTDNSNTNLDIAQQKWSCTVCTYLNWPKSLKCVQCYTLKSNDSSASSHGDINKKTIDNNDSCTVIPTKIELVNSPKTTPLNRSLCNSPCTVLSKTAINQSIELIATNTTTSTTPLIDETTKKWSCTACTYQNWPKAQRCVMCHIPRNIDKKPNTINSNNNNNNNNKNMQTTTNQKQHQLQQMQRKLKNYQIQMDCLFLAACQGIVDNDMTHLNMYVNSGGDLTRYLTSEECAMLNRPQIFTVGLTLLHLCYQFKRKEFLIEILNKSTNSNNNSNIIKKNIIQQSQPANTKVLSALIKSVNKTKFSPCQSCPTLASNIIDRYFSASLRQRKTQHKSIEGNNLMRSSTSNSIDPSLIGATNATLFSSNYYHNSSSSPTSSLISLNSNGNNMTTSNVNVNVTNSNNNNNSPSPSPPPHGATSSLYYHNYRHNNHQHICFYVNESHTFTLPNQIEDFSPRIQHILYDELLDREVQQELENESRIINWNKDLCKRLNSKLYPLWNRHSGDCLLDSVLQACYGVFDTDNTLRRVMAESLEQYAFCFKPRWKEHEILMAQSLDYKLDDYQLEQDWNNILSLANQPGASLEQAHIFALCHIFRRPIIVYSVKYVKSFRGENIGFTHFEGVYLPLIWEPQFCFKSPIALGYTRGHFTALVPFEKSEVINYMTNNNSSYENENENDMDNVCGCSNNNNGDGDPSTSAKNNSAILGAVSSSSNLEANENQQQQQTFYLPLANNEGHLLPVHFLTSSELGRERSILKQYLNLDCIVMQGSNCGLLVAQQRVAKRGMLISRMLEEWLSYYKNMQAKEYGRQIELSQEKEQNIDEFKFNAENSSPLINSLPQVDVQDNQYQEDEDHEDSGDEDEDSPDEDDDDDDDDEDEDNESADEDYDDDYADEVEVQ